ncbi:hypothetical protein [Frondihabitans australicus]|uniref:hypothetical protein n=1 Tax=Frondihabitans australicus TaxID=386892 RepID=UPI0011C4A8E9|nr:hypothetical protein [Frondihabitans australicus]
MERDARTTIIDSMKKATAALQTTGQTGAHYGWATRADEAEVLDALAKLVHEVGVQLWARDLADSDAVVKVTKQVLARAETLHSPSPSCECPHDFYRNHSSSGCDSCDCKRTTGRSANGGRWIPFPGDKPAKDF